VNHLDIPPRLTFVPATLRTRVGLAVWAEPDLQYVPLIEVAEDNGPPLRHGHPDYALGGASLFCVHVEVPVSGNGEEPADCYVLERGADGSVERTAYFDWCRKLQLEILCPRCRQDVLDPATKRCDPNAEFMRRVESGEIDLSDIPLLDDPSTWSPQRPFPY